MAFKSIIGIFIFGLLFTTSVSAITINASDYNVGDDISDLPGATLSYYTHEWNSETVSFTAASISNETYTCGTSDSGSCSANAIGGITHGNHWPNQLWGDIPVDQDPFTTADLTTVKAFAGLSLTSDQGRIGSFGLSGLTDYNSGDLPVIYLFGESGNLLNDLQGDVVGGAHADPTCSFDTCWRFDYYSDFSNQEVFEVRFGSYDAYNFIDSITYTVVPVPAAVWLFGSGLLGLVGLARRKA